MAKRRLPPKLTDSPARIRSRPYESEWARLPRDEVWDRGLPGQGPRGSIDEHRSVPTMAFVGGFGLVLLGIFLRFGPMIGVGLAAMVVSAVVGAVIVTRRKGQRATLLWGGIGSTDIDPAKRSGADREPISEGGDIG